MHSHAAASIESKMATKQHKIFCDREFTKTEPVTAVHRAFRLSQPVERAENLEYRNQLSGVCWGAVYCSIGSIFLNHPVLYSYFLNII